MGRHERRAVDGEEPGRCHVVLEKGKVRGGHWGSLSKWDTGKGGLMGRAVKTRRGQDTISTAAGVT